MIDTIERRPPAKSCICHEHNPECDCAPPAYCDVPVHLIDDPEPPAVFLNAEQLRFLWLHASHHVVKWQWHFLETMLRAYTDKGQTASIWRDNLNDLLQRGLLEHGHGCADVRITDLGREFAQ